MKSYLRPKTIKIIEQILFSLCFILCVNQFISVKQTSDEYHFEDFDKLLAQQEMAPRFTKSMGDVLTTTLSPVAITPQASRNSASLTTLLYVSVGAFITIMQTFVCF